MTLFFKIFAAIVASTIFLFVLRIAFINYAINKVTESSREILAAQQAMLEHQRLDQAEFYRRKEELKYQEALIQAKARELALNKEQAWARWYKNPEGCDSWQTDHGMVFCTNEKIRAKKEFDKLWLQGLIKG
jgi:hypothetical protein